MIISWTRVDVYEPVVVYQHPPKRSWGWIKKLFWLCVVITVSFVVLKGCALPNKGPRPANPAGRGF